MSGGEGARLEELCIRCGVFIVRAGLGDFRRTEKRQFGGREEGGRREAALGETRRTLSHWRTKRRLDTL